MNEMAKKIDFHLGQYRALSQILRKLEAEIPRDDTFYFIGHLIAAEIEKIENEVPHIVRYFPTNSVASRMDTSCYLDAEDIEITFDLRANVVRKDRRVRSGHVGNFSILASAEALDEIPNSIEFVLSRLFESLAVDFREEKDAAKKIIQEIKCMVSLVRAPKDEFEERIS